MSLTSYMLHLPQYVYGGEGSLNNIKSITEGNYKKAAVFTDAGIKKAGLIDKPLNLLKESGVDYAVIDDVPTEPLLNDAEKIIKEFRSINADFIIAIGGGSVMDTAKLASVLDTDSYTLRDLLKHPEIAVKNTKTLMIPTTAGTGSEATPNSIINVPELELKVGIVNNNMIADYVILDASLIKNLPRHIAASTGIDALAHAIECYTSLKANPLSDIFALEALSLILPNIENSCNDKNNYAAKNAMLTASFYAGLAICASGTTAVHALSYPLGGKYRIAHGVSNAMLLVPVMRFNEDACRDRLSKVYDRVNTYGEAKTAEEKSSWVINKLGSIVKNLDIPTNLNKFGVTKDDLDILVTSALKVTRLLNNNCKKLSSDDVASIYKQLL